MILSISGFMGSGKDTVAEYLEKEYDFYRESWAGALKDAMSNIFGWDRELLEGKTLKSRVWRETLDVWWSERLGKEIIPRRVLQEWGTEVCRENFHDEIWIACLENKLRHITKNVVISDTRFPNEIASVKSLGGITIRIKRGDDPEWVKDYLKAGKTPEFVEKHPNIHASEYSSVNCKFDYIIENNSTIEDLYKKINNLVQCHLFSK